MITTATNNLSPAIHSQGFFSRTIHSQHRHLRPKLPQTAHAAQLNRKLQPFYAKQTQFQKPEMNLTTYCKTAYGNARLRGPHQNKPNFEPTTADTAGSCFGGQKWRLMAMKRKKENIEQLPATRCFPEGRKTLNYIVIIGQRFLVTLARESAQASIFCTFFVREGSEVGGNWVI